MQSHQPSPSGAFTKYSGTNPVRQNATSHLRITSKSRLAPAYQLQQLVQRASVKMSALKQRHISPHTFRHSMAMGLLEAGIATEVIALFLGHETPKTTHLYMEASLTMKKQALEKISPPKTKRSSFQPDEALLRFLENL